MVRLSKKVQESNLIVQNKQASLLRDEKVFKSNVLKDENGKNKKERLSVKQILQNELVGNMIAIFLALLCLSLGSLVERIFRKCLDSIF